MESLTAEEYRLDKIREIELEIINEIEIRKSSHKKYNKVFNIVNVSDVILKTAALGMGTAGISLLPTPVGIPLAIGGLLIGPLSLVSSFINSKVLTKLNKHNNIRISAEATLGTIENLISKALDNSKISDEDFKLILKEQSKFRLMKEKIRKKSLKTFKEIDQKFNSDLKDYTDSPDSKKSSESKSS